MKIKLLSLVNKLYFKKWIIGICSGNINDILKNKTFNPDVQWLNSKSKDKFEADPFILESNEDTIDIICEEYFYNKKYGTLAVLSLDKNFKEIDRKIILDTKSHLSYPFVYKDNNIIYIFPESGQSGKLSCYKYIPGQESLVFVKNIINLPLLDSTIIKHKSKYYIFGTIENNNQYDLQVFFSDNLLGPYNEHPNNPVKSGLNGTRSAGNFIRFDGDLFRPVQNCKEQYGQSITINKIKELNEHNIVEEFYMEITINNIKNKNMHTIHTINIMDNIVVIDGMYWSFQPFFRIKEFLKKKSKIYFF